jgi:hypothetical protein
MGNDISAGHTYSSTSPNNAVTASNLNEHVNGATLKPTAISARTAKTPVLGSEEILINDGGILKKATVATLGSFIFPDGSIDKDKLTPDAIHGQTEKENPVPADEILIYDSVGATLKKATFASLADQPLGGARGVVIKSTAGATLTISVEAIVLLNADGAATRHLSPAQQTVSIDSTGANGRDAAKEFNKWYYIWGISDGTNFRGLLSQSATAPTMPAGFTYKLMLGVVRNGASAFVPFVQYGANVACARTSVFTNIGPNDKDELQSQSIADQVPPNAVACNGLAYSSATDPNDWGIAVAGSEDLQGATVFALDVGPGTANPWLFGGKRIFSFSMVPILSSQTIFWTAKKDGNTSCIDITGYALNL